MKDTLSLSLRAQRGNPLSLQKTALPSLCHCDRSGNPLSLQKTALPPLCHCERSEAIPITIPIKTQVVPARVHRLDKIYFLLPGTCLYLFLPCNSLVNPLKLQSKPVIAIVSGSKTRDLVLIHALKPFFPGYWLHPYKEPD
jgi:hypothetical protein